MDADVKDFEGLWPKKGERSYPIIIRRKDGKVKSLEDIRFGPSDSESQQAGGWRPGGLHPVSSRLCKPDRRSLSQDPDGGRQPRFRCPNCGFEAFADPQHQSSNEESPEACLDN